MSSIFGKRLRIVIGGKWLDDVIWREQKLSKKESVYNFFKIGISSVIALILSIDEVQKVSVIQMAALHCIFLKILRG